MAEHPAFFRAIQRDNLRRSPSSLNGQPAFTGGILVDLITVELHKLSLVLVGNPT
jgi:hypothetical protein